jgi:hypothetical protein
MPGLIGIPVKDKLGWYYPVYLLAYQILNTQDKMIEVS